MRVVVFVLLIPQKHKLEEVPRLLLNFVLSSTKIQTKLNASPFEQTYSTSNININIPTNSANMKVIAFLSLLTLGTAASLPVSLYPEAKLEDRQLNPVSANGNHTCKVIGPAPAGKDTVPCYYCDKTSCDIVVEFVVNKEYKFDCLCPRGEAINGIR
jgi:hypothetical protein